MSRLRLSRKTNDPTHTIAVRIPLNTLPQNRRGVKYAANL